ncbi:MAG: hypothetical protein EZS28_056265, partial [Streblomastix strix]
HDNRMVLKDESKDASIQSLPPILSTSAIRHNIICSENSYININNIESFSSQEDGYSLWILKNGSCDVLGEAVDLNLGSCLFIPELSTARAKKQKKQDVINITIT